MRQVNNFRVGQWILCYDSTGVKYPTYTKKELHIMQVTKIIKYCDWRLEVNVYDIYSTFTNIHQKRMLEKPITNSYSGFANNGFLHRFFIPFACRDPEYEIFELTEDEVASIMMDIL